MRIFATRRESEMILQALYKRMSEIPISEMGEYKDLTDRICRVNSLQCAKDKSSYRKGD